MYHAHRSTCILVATALACSWLGCVPVEARKTYAPFEKAEVVRRVYLADSNMARLSVRREDSRVAIRLEDLTLCRNDLLVSRGVEVTTQRTPNAKVRTAEWIGFGTSLGITALGLAWYSDADCGHEAVVCLEKVVALGVTIMAAIDAAVSGTFVLVDELRAVDTSESFETSRTSERVIKICGYEPKQGVVAQATFSGVRARAVTNDEGQAELELNLPPGPLADVTVQLWLDGAALGSVPVSSEWRHAVLRGR